MDIFGKVDSLNNQREDARCVHNLSQSEALEETRKTFFRFGEEGTGMGSPCSTRERRFERGKRTSGSQRSQRAEEENHWENLTSRGREKEKGALIKSLPPSIRVNNPGRRERSQGPIRNLLEGGANL